MENTGTHKFKWGTKACSGKHDPRHTISGLEADPYLDYWISTMRAGCPWQLEDAQGNIVRQGVK